MESPKLMTTVEAAKYLGIGRSTLILMLKQGTIKKVPIAGTYRVAKSDLDDYLKNVRV